MESMKTAVTAEQGHEGGVKVYVVSLARATERRQAVSDQLSRHGVDFVFVDAVDAKETDPALLQSHVDEAAVMRNRGRKLSGPEIGCALSHRLVYRDIVETGRCGGLVLEDDAIIPPVFLDALAYFHERGPKLSGERAIYHLEALSRPYARDLVLRKRTSVKVGEALRFAERINGLSVETWGTCGYYVTREAAVSLLASPKIETVADRWSLWARQAGGRIFVSMPAVVVHPNEFSDSEIEMGRRSLQERSRDASFGRFISAARWLYYGVRARIMRYVVRPLAERIL